MDYNIVSETSNQNSRYPLLRRHHAHFPIFCLPEEVKCKCKCKF